MSVQPSPTRRSIGSGARGMTQITAAAFLVNALETCNDLRLTVDEAIVSERYQDDRDREARRWHGAVSIA